MFYKTSDLASGVLFKTTVRDSIINLMRKVAPPPTYSKSIYQLWCYPFERYNGILGSFPTNSEAIETQLMKKFITSQSIQATQRVESTTYSA